MWVKVDDGFPDHDKVADAGARLERSVGKMTGATGTGRVIAVWLSATCYSNDKLTDGFVTEAVAGRFHCDQDPLEVFRAMQFGDHGLAKKVRGGWQLLNYHRYQPAKADVVKGRKKARERMRKLRGGSARSVRANKSEHSKRSREQKRTGSIPFATPDPTRIKDQDQNRRSTAADASATALQEVKAAS